MPSFEAKMEVSSMSLKDMNELIRTFAYKMGLAHRGFTANFEKAIFTNRHEEVIYVKIEAIYDFVKSL